MFSTLLAGASALVWGSADFCGGKATQTGKVLAVTVVSQLFSLPVLAACLLVVKGDPRSIDMMWGGGAGAAALFGLLLLYRALAGGAMAVVAPVTAVTAALVPMVIGLAMHKTPGALPLVGAVCAIAAIALVSLGPGGARAITANLLGLALLAGTMFGLFFALLGQASLAAGMWPLLGARATSIAIGLAMIITTRTSLRLPRSALRWAAIGGPLDIAANALYLAAVREGNIVIVAPIASLYPASTVILALVIDRERLRTPQIVGLVLAAAALVLSAS